MYFKQVHDFVKSFKYTEKMDRYLAVTCPLDILLSKSETVSIDRSPKWDLLRITHSDNKKLKNTCVLLYGGKSIFLLGEDSKACDEILEVCFNSTNFLYGIELGSKGSPYKRYSIKELGYGNWICMGKETYRGWH